MYFFGIALIGILGGLAIALLTNWFPAYWNKQESEWKAELLSETQEATQHSVEKHSDFNLKKLLGEVFLVENRSNLILCLIIGITLSLPNFVLHGWTDLALLQFSLICSFIPPYGLGYLCKLYRLLRPLVWCLQSGEPLLAI